MTISTTTRKAGPYLGDGTQTRFDFTFKVFKGEDLLITYTDAFGIESALVFGANYQVTLNKDQENSPGGYITITTPPKNGSKITITSNASYLQPTKITNQGGFFPSVINDSLDRLTIYAQQLDEQVKRSVKVKVSDDDSPDDLINSLQKDVALAKQAAADAQNSASESQESVSEAQQAVTDARAIADELADGLEDLQGVIKKADIATVEEIQAGTAGKVVDAQGLKNEKVYFRVDKSTEQIVGRDIATRITGFDVILDNKNGFESNAYTVQVSGVYILQIGFSTSYAGNNKALEQPVSVRIHKNGDFLAIAGINNAAVPDGRVTFQGSQICQLVAGDVLTFMVLNSIADKIAISPGVSTFFSGILI